MVKYLLINEQEWKSLTGKAIKVNQKQVIGSKKKRKNEPAVKKIR